MAAPPAPHRRPLADIAYIRNGCICLTGAAVRFVPECIVALRSHSVPVLALVSIECGMSDVWHLFEACALIDTVQFRYLSRPEIPEGYQSPHRPGVRIRSWIDDSCCHSMITYAHTLISLGAAGIVDLSAITSIGGLRLTAGIYERGMHSARDFDALPFGTVIDTMNVLLGVIPNINRISMVEVPVCNMWPGGATTGMLKAYLHARNPKLTVDVVLW